MKVLMVCLGNICRSPLAEGILQNIVDKQGLDWEVDSAGTASYHVGNLPDARAIEIANERGIDISHQRARQIVEEDFDRFDLILAMDAENYNNILALRPLHNDCSVKLILNYTHPGENRQVPDPYYGGGFGVVYDMLAEACERVVDGSTN